LRLDDRLVFPFSFGPFLGFWAAFEGAIRLGNLCLAAGGMTSGARLDFLEANRATVVACTPTYALRLAEVAAERGQDLAQSSVRALVVAGEPGGNVAEIKRKIETLWGARCFDHTGMTEIGSLGIECLERPGSVHLLESECLAQVLGPQTDRPVSDGEIGELVLTNLGRWGSPLVRYRTGDLVKPRWQVCECGRNWVWLEGGILGRIDDMVVVRGNNVYPSAVEAVIRRLDEVAEYRVEVRSRGALVALRIDLEPTAAAADETADLVGRVQTALHDTLGLRADVTAVPPGSLPRFELKARRFVRHS